MKNNPNTRYITHFMKLNPSPFAMIKNGTKTIELRLYDEKRQKIKAGDTIIFTNTVDGQTLSVKVQKLHIFKTFEDLYASLPLLQCGYSVDTLKMAHPSDMEKYYPEDEQAKHSVVGIELII